MIKNRRKYEKPPNSTKYRAHSFKNSFIALPVPENPMLEKRILNLSPIGKKLGGPPETYRRHLGFSAARFNIDLYIITKLKIHINLGPGGGADIVIVHPGL